FPIRGRRRRRTTPTTFPAAGRSVPGSSGEPRLERRVTAYVRDPLRQHRRLFLVMHPDDRRSDVWLERDRLSGVIPGEVDDQEFRVGLRDFDLSGPVL